MNDIQELKFYTLEEVAPILGVSVRTLYNYIKAGTFQAKKIGGKWKITGDNLKAFIEGAESTVASRPKKDS